MNDDFVGVLIGGYKIKSKIASGGMGAVYLAQHVRLQEQRAVKVLLPQAVMRQESVTRFEREAIATSRLAHPNILQIHELGRLASGQPFIMAEYLEGQALDKLLRDGPLTIHRTLAVVLQLCAALEHAHRHGVIHRDIKPGNIFYCPTEKEPFRIKLFDFGVAKVADANDGARTRAGVGCGTPLYMAVEQYQNANIADERSDIYSIAVLAVEMATGHLPWGTHDFAQTAHFLQRTTPPDLEGVPESWLPTIRSALQVDPKLRPSSTRAFGLALAHATLEGAVLVRSLTPNFLRDSVPQVAPHDAITLSPPPAITLALPTPPTTISLSTGALQSPTPQRAHLLSLMLLAIVVGGLGSFIAFAMTNRTAPTPAQHAPSLPAPSPPPTPDAAPPTLDAVTPDATPPDAPPVPPPPPRPRVKRVVAPESETFDPSSPIGK